MTRVLVIGLDGVPLELINPWMAEGRLPHLAGLIARGSVGRLNSTIPHTSAPAWTAFMTGKNPAKTGIYDFLYRRPGSYSFPPNNARMRDGQALWQILSKHERRVAVLNVPLTYPVDPVNGVMVGGWMTPYQAPDFTHPPQILDEMEAATGPYTIYPLATFSEEQPDRYFAACRELAHKRTEAALYLLEQEAWDFFMMVFFDTDRILHQLWHYLDPSHRWRAGDRDVDKSKPVRDYFEHLDRCIGRILEKTDEDTLVLVMSDHGMGAARDMIVLNTWLLNQGWLRLRRRPLTRAKHALFRAGFTLRNIHQTFDKLGLARHAEYKVMYSANRLLRKIFLSFDDVEWSQSRAYSFGRSVGPIYLNVRGREPQGIVAPGAEYERLRQELATQALAMRHPQTGAKLVRDVLLREEVYSGPYLEQAPDLILLPQDEADKFYGLSDFGAHRVVLPMYRYSGMHRQHGMVILAGPQIQAGTAPVDAQIVDLAPTILHALQVPIPADIDGRPLLELFTAGHRRRPVRQIAPTTPLNSTGRENGYSAEEAQQVEERLRRLGYMG